MPAFAKATVCVHGLAPMHFTKWNLFDREFIEQTLEHAVRITPETRLQDDPGFGEGGRTNGDGVATGELCDQVFIARLAKHDGEEDGRVDDQTPSDP